MCVTRSVAVIWGLRPPERRLSRHASLSGLDSRRGSWPIGKCPTAGLSMPRPAPPAAEESGRPRPERSFDDPSRTSAPDHSGTAARDLAGSGHVLLDGRGARVAHIAGAADAHGQVVGDA